MRDAPRLTAISSGRSATGPEFSAWLEALRAARVDAVQIREKAADDRTVARLAEEAIRTLEGVCRVLVSGRADIALATGADGVHLPGSGLPELSVRRLIGAGRLIGRSAHTLDEVERARDAGADYVYLSPIFETPGKGPALGLATLERAAGLGLPVVALGGITIDRLPAVAAAGAAGVAGIRMFASATVIEPLAGVGDRYFRKR